jgi:hypothetical protein
MISDTDGSARSRAGDARGPLSRVEAVSGDASKVSDVRGPTTSLLHPEAFEVVGPRFPFCG